MTGSVSSLRHEAGPQAPGSRAIPRYVGEPGKECFAWLHPGVPTAAGSAGVVICSPLGYDAVPAHRTLRHLAERLAAHGITTLRPDYAGTGDSTGTDTDPSRVEAWVDSVVAGVRELKGLLPGCPVFVIGLRLGAMLAAVATSRESVDGAVFWGALRTGRRYLREMQALSLKALDDAAGEASGEGLESAGYLLTEETVRDLRGLDMTRLTYPSSLDVLVVERDDLPPDRVLVDHLSAETASVVTERPPGYQGMMAEPHYTRVPEDAVERIVEWVAGRAAPRAPEPLTWNAPDVIELRGADVGITEQPTRFGPDDRLFGIVTCPARGSDASRPAVVLLNAGSVNRTGPNRMYVHLARRWGSLGLTCLRFDFGGIGDSEQAAGWRENDPYSPHAHDDIVAALSALRDRYGHSEFVLAGLCSGAFSAFTSGLRADGIVRSVLINPLTFYWEDGMTLDTPTFQHFLAMKQYRQSMRTWSSWKKLLTGKVNVLAVARTVAGRGVRAARSWIGAVRHALGVDRQDADNLRRDLERLVERGVKMSFFFAESDPGFDLLMLEAGNVVRRLERSGRLSIEIIEGADHTFTPFPPRRELADRLTATLTAPARGEVGSVLT